MTDAPIPAAPKKGMNPILKWLLIGCGTLVLLSILAFASCVYLFKKKVYDPAKEGMNQAKSELAKNGVTIDTSHGLKGMAYSGTVAIIQGMKPMVMISLPKADQPAANKAFSDLSAKSGSLTESDMDDLNTAMQTYNDSNNAYRESHGTPMDPDAARKFVSDLQAIADRH